MIAGSDKKTSQQWPAHQAETDTSSYVAHVAPAIGVIDAYINHVGLGDGLVSRSKPGNTAAQYQQPQPTKEVDT